MTGQKIVAGLEAAIAHAKSVPLGDKIRALQRMGEALGSWRWDCAEKAPDPCPRCGATVMTRTFLGGFLETVMREFRCSRCRHEWEIEKEAGNG